MKLKPRAQIIARIALGLVLLMAAAFITVFINNALAQRQPENALPDLDVYYDIEKGDRLPVDHIRRDAYNWQFLFWERSGGGLDLEVWRGIRPGLVNSNSPLQLVFTTPPTSVSVGMKNASDNFGAFTVLGSQIMTPGEPGDYVYKVEALWTETRTIVYYFRIEVPW